MEGAGLVGLIDVVTREATLFAAIWFLIGGLDDLLVDLVYIAYRTRQWLRHNGRTCLPGTVVSGRIIVFVAAWQEEKVIGKMLRSALQRFDHPDYRIYVGTYPNDPGTVRRVAEVAAFDPRVKLVVGSQAGPTTKADCLNTLWRALLRDEAEEGRAAAIVLHDAEDSVHALELRVFADRLRRFDAVQLPVLPLRAPGSPLVSGHYCDEFAESHIKLMPVRQALGAAMPFAGVGCAIRRDMIGRIADARGGLPFDDDSLTEDYELGLTIAAMGGRTSFARVPESPGGPPVAVRAYFPEAVAAAARQKSRWMLGIALAGWDRTGWGAAAKIGDHWMRMRDRRAILEIPVLAIAYCALVLWVLSFAVHALLSLPQAGQPPAMRVLLALNLALLGWRFAARAVFTGSAYGWRDALLSVPRLFVGNIIALIAARLALLAYLRLLAGAAPHWDKTEHHFPDDAELAAA